MSSIATHAHDSHHAPDYSHDPRFRESNIRASGGSLSMLCLVVAVLGIGATVAAAFAGPGKVHAMASFQAAAMGGLAICLGGMFFTLVMHLMAAGWSVTLRRQLENMMVLAPIMLIVASVVPLYDLFVGHGLLYTWMSPEFSGNVLLQKKAAFLNPSFFCVRLMIYFTLWSIIAWKMNGYSVRQDQTGDKWLTAQARFSSAWAMLVFALSTAFCAFDLLMSLDFRFFSTMWGVYYFAATAFSSVAFLVLIVASLRRVGKLEGLVNSEHFHDTGKLMFTFTVFWAYIAFSQYFLIWYSNIPEETAWFLVRKQHGWQYVFYLLCFGHFIAPFLILLFRSVKRSYHALMLIAVWMIFINFTDMFFIVRPMVTTRDTVGETSPMSGLWVDFAAALGVLGLLGFLVIRRMAKLPLVPTKDPRLPEALHHANYV
ncbi:MAG: hypothetical protein U0573_14085 [Phycisphaerales bacterium]|nr:hypothetical protein [Planctomycetota bacterium]